MLEITDRLRLPEEELQWRFVRSSGPGGQNVNKVASKAVLRWDLAGSPSLPEDVKARLRTQERGRITVEGELILSSQRYRDQERNKQDCLSKLLDLLRRAAMPARKRRPTRPTRASRQRRLREKRHRSTAKKQRQRPVED
jgi:ribosome-associated protein